MYFDTHAHFDDKAFDEDRHELFDIMREDGVSLILNPGCEVQSSSKKSIF